MGKRKLNDLQEINDPELQNIVSALAKDNYEETDSKAYFSESELNLSDIAVEVEGIGTVELPLTKSCIERLIGVSSKAKFGWREEAILDENVRNTNEIVAEKLRVTIEPSSMTRLLSTIREDLGLNKLSDLTPHLHNMLIYSRGQFFERHQDTERMDSMVATLVVVLPSAHIGGDLVIDNSVNMHEFSTENVDELGVKCIAFYAHCMHEVKRVKHGYRVALTFNLVLNSVQSPSDEESQRLREAIQNYFWDENSKEPQKLVYFLNHEYSEHGLKQVFLEGSDRVNVSTLLNVAESLHLVPHLTLVEIEKSHVTWRDDFDSEDEYEYDYDQGWFYEYKTTISYWVDTSNRKVNHGNLKVASKEICWTKGLQSFKAFKTKHEEYMRDRVICKRAAVILWAESRQTTMNFVLNRKTATRELLQLTLDLGNENIIIDIVHKAGGYLYGNNTRNSVEEFITLAEIALYVRDKSVATKVLSCFSRSVVQVPAAEILAKFQNEYGVNWFVSMLYKWLEYHTIYDIDKVDEFLQTFLQKKGDLKIAEKLLEQQRVTDEPSNAHGLSWPWQSEKSCKGFMKLREIFKACEVIQNVPMLHKFIQLVEENPKKYPFLELVDLFLNLKDEINPSFYPHFTPLKTYLLNTVNAEISLNKEYTKDWSLKIPNPVPCNCASCTEAMEFLASKTEQKKRWAIGLKFRNHVTPKLNSLNLPIDISVDKSCFPHRLIIEKNRRMFNEAQEMYKKLKSCQEALNLHKFEIKMEVIEI